MEDCFMKRTRRNILIVAMILIVLIVVVVGLLNWSARPKIRELASEYSCTKNEDCAAWLSQGTCQWKIINKETAAEWEAARQIRKRDNKLHGVGGIEVSCGGWVPVGTFCRQGRCVGKMQYSKFYH